MAGRAWQSLRASAARRTLQRCAGARRNARGAGSLPKGSQAAPLFGVGLACLQRRAAGIIQFEGC